MTILWDEWAEKYKWELVGAAIAITLIGIGTFMWRSHTVSKDSIQVLSASDTNPKVASASAMVVDVSGAVNRPGVYELASGARVDDALESAGGVTESADSNWIELNINRAEKVRDGMKIFIPAKGNSESVFEAKITPLADNNTIDINSATAEQLDTLKGVGPVTAEKIINGRPYSNIEELLNKKIVSKNVFNQIKDQIRAW